MARAQFELKFLSSEVTGCPPEAPTCSAVALAAMMMLHSEHEDVLAVKGELVYTSMIVVIQLM